MEKRTRGVGVAKVCVLVALFALVMAIVVVALSGKETYNSATYNEDELKTLYCEAGELEGGLFNFDDASGVKNIVKYVYGGDNILRLSYTYTANFELESVAKARLATMHADYNEYMGKTDVYFDSLSPAFNLFDTSVSVNLFIERNLFTVDTSKMVFLSTSDYITAKKAKIEDLKKLYEKKNFTCKIVD